MTPARRLALACALMLCACGRHGTVPPADTQAEQRAERERAWRRAERRVRPGSLAPRIEAPCLFPGETRRADQLRSTRRVVLFWASWCGDCRAETPALTSLQRRRPDVEWITVSLDNEAEKARRYVRESGLEGLHLFDGRDWRGETCADFAVALHGIPYLIYIDETGVIRWTGGEARRLEHALD